MSPEQADFPRGAQPGSHAAQTDRCDYLLRVQKSRTEVSRTVA